MITLKQFNESTSSKRRGMAARLKEKVWMTGRRAHKVAPNVDYCPIHTAKEGEVL